MADEVYEWGDDAPTQAVRAGLDGGLDGQAAAELAKLRGQFYGPLEGTAQIRVKGVPQSTEQERTLRLKPLSD